MHSEAKPKVIGCYGEKKKPQTNHHLQFLEDKETMLYVHSYKCTSVQTKCCRRLSLSFATKCASYPNSRNFWVTLSDPSPKFDKGSESVRLNTRHIKITSAIRAI